MKGGMHYLSVNHVTQGELDIALESGSLILEEVAEATLASLKDA